MKKVLFAIILINHSLFSYAQGVGINDDGSMPADGAILDIKSNSRGLLIPRMTEAQRDAITPDTQSMLIYQTNNDSGFYFYDGSVWTPFLIGGAAANSGWTTKGNTGTTPANNFIGTVDSVDWIIKTDSTEQMRVMSNGNIGVGTNNPSSTHHISGSSAAKITTVTAATYTAANETHILADASGNAITITLPPAADVTDRIYYIKKIDATANVITIDANGSETIDGATTQSLNRQYENISLICNGSSWFIENASAGVISSPCDAFFAHNNGVHLSTAMPNFTLTQLIFSTESFDDGDMYNTTNGRFTPPEGRWLIKMQVRTRLNNTQTAPISLTSFIYKNGSPIAQDEIRMGDWAGGNTSVSIIVEANGTDYFEAFHRMSNAGFTATVYGESYRSFFQATRIDCGN